MSVGISGYTVEAIYVYSDYTYYMQYKALVFTVSVKVKFGIIWVYHSF